MTKTKPRHGQHTKQVKKDKPKWIDPAIVVALIGLVGTIIVALLNNPYLLPTIIQKTFIPTPTATPIPSYAQIKSLDITKDGNIIATLDPNERKDLTTGGAVLIKVNIIPNKNFDNLLFSWEFCDKTYNFSGQGAIESTYHLAEGVNCITVTITEGGKFLNKADFFVIVHNNQP